MNENKSNDTSLLIALIVLFAIVVWGLDYYSVYFYELWKWIRVAQLSVISWIPEGTPFIGDAMSHMKSLYASDSFDFSEALVDSVDHIYYPIFGWLGVGFLFYLSTKVERTNEGVYEKLSMDGILHKYAKSFPFLKPYVDFNPAKMTDLTFDRTDTEKLKFLPALQPVEYATMAPPLFLEGDAKNDSSLMAPIWSPDDGVGFDDDLAEKAFKKQLGDHYSDIDSLSATERKIYDFLVKKISFNKSEMQKLVKEMADDICQKGGGKKSYSGSKKVLYKKIMAKRNNVIEQNKKLKEKNKKNPDIIKNERYINRLVDSKEFESILLGITGEGIMRSHAFVYCGLMSMLDTGRKGGVIPPVEFMWIKLENRTLYFALSSVGKKVSYVESAGVFSHWLLENLIGRPVPTPEVTEAVNGLKVALYIDENSKK